MNSNRNVSLCLLFFFLFQACQPSENSMSFELLTSNQTGVDFNNRIMESDSLNILKFEYLYNGAGVGIGDFNNDGQQDIFFAGNMVSSKLYLNTGDFKFKDVTETAKVTTTHWCTGVAIVDINQDGFEDIYLSTIHPDKTKSSPNLFFLNKGIDKNGVPVFEELAVRMGLADSSYATQAAFLDYDLDGDLDMYLVNNALEDFNRNTPYGQRKDGTGKSVDKLYRNSGNDTNGLPQFVNVSKEANILMEGWGLGVIVNDFNQDGYPDVYVTNDFLSSDHLYINNQNSTFSNQVANYLKHQEYNGMGVDAADINNDGRNEIIGVDMMPNDNLRQKTMFSNIGYDRFWLNRQRGYQDQYVRNVLQFNNGNGTFSDIGYLSGVYCTDWSWSALLADFDNDGFRDLLITNGYPKDVTDLDFTSYNSGANMFGTKEARLEKAMASLDKLVGVKKSNFIFKNNQDLTFTNKATAWGLDQPSYTNGAAYGDLDNDGDLDLVMNNINDEAFVYRNNLQSNEHGRVNYLRINLITAKGKRSLPGAKVWIHSNGKFQYAEHQLQRGYKSTVEPYIHFGLEKIGQVDSLVVTWAGGKKQVLKNVSTNQVITVNERNAIAFNKVKNDKAAMLFEEAHKSLHIIHKHEEGLAVDFKEGQALLPQMHSRLGPAVAAGDVDGDGLEDFIVGGAAEKSTSIYFQKPNGYFESSAMPPKKMEDMGILLFDADKDGDLDLYCASGSSEFGRGAHLYQDRFYENVGGGKFSMDTTAIPHMESSGSCVTACDFDKDGDLDLFVGGRIVPLKYPSPPESSILRNDGHGNFSKVTKEIAPSLEYTGMITSALWSDVDNDGWTDLIAVGEWMPITIFKNIAGKKFEPMLSKNLTRTVGWWNSLVAGDFDSDGDTDYIAGNLGLNSIFQASEKEPVSVYANDYDGNGSYDPVICRFIEGIEYPTHYRETMTDQMVFLRRSLMRYSIYGRATLNDFLPQDKLTSALVYKAEYFRSAYIENTGNENFSVKPLPIEAQTAPFTAWWLPILTTMET
jgi:enediyne biosynthesis protein E4